MSKKLLVLLLPTALLSACVVAPYPRRVAYAAPVPIAAPVESNVYVDLPPPAPYVEVIPSPPFAGGLWIGGYWGWYGGRHQWVPGRWEHARPGYQWHPHAWVQDGGRWHLQGGGWVRH